MAPSGKILSITLARQSQWNVPECNTHKCIAVVGMNITGPREVQSSVYICPSGDQAVHQGGVVSTVYCYISHEFKITAHTDMDV
jgi:hypothetical protein